MKREWVRPLFVFAAVYDLVLGLAFLLAFKPIYRWFRVELPNLDAYLHFGAALVIVFGIAFAMVAANPVRHRSLVPLGILFKLAFSGVVLGHAATGTIPAMWVPFAWIDLLFVAAFALALRAIPAEGATVSREAAPATGLRP